MDYGVLAAKTMKYYEVHVIKTYKAVGRGEDWRQFEETTEKFPTLAAAKQYLKDTYGSCKRVPMYKDGEDGTGQKVGYIYSFKAYPASYGDKHGFEAHWVQILEIKATIIL